MSNNTAKRYNKNKVELSRVPEVALLEEAKVWMYGEKKYPREDPKGPANWRKLWGDETVNVALNSALRHIMAMCEGKMLDEETGLPNASHVRCNMAFILQYMADEKLLNPHIYDAKEPPKNTKESEEPADKPYDRPSYYQGGCY